MTTVRFAKTAAISSLLLVGLALTGCSGASATQPSSAGESAAAPAAETKAPAPAPDLTGKWKQSNSKSKDAYQEATIKGDTITVNWVTDDGDTTSLFWAGSFEAPTSADAYSWKSKNDKSKTSKALLASPDKTKTFFYEDGEISYPVSLMGTTTKVRLKKQ